MRTSEAVMSLCYYEARLSALRKVRDLVKAHREGHFVAAGRSDFAVHVDDRELRVFDEIVASYESTVKSWEKRLAKCKARDRREAKKAAEAAASEGI